MHSNIIVTKGHHTCNNGAEAYIKANAPFKSVRRRDARTSELVYSYLGDGYYFWDDNIELARYWGSRRYNNDYSIIEIDITLKGDKVLDLVGSRQHLTYFARLIEKLENKEGRSIGIGEAIWLLKLLNTRNKGTFEYTVFRAIDTSLSKEFYKFENSKKGGMYMNPAIIICYIDKKEVPLQSIRIV